jgi:hypothetical protein
MAIQQKIITLTKNEIQKISGGFRHIGGQGAKILRKKYPQTFNNPKKNPCDLLGKARIHCKPHEPHV